jgi:hypothetical protein
MNEPQVLWSTVFTDPDFEYDLTDPLIKKIACADCLLGWATCYLEKPPDQFGWGMLKIMDIIGTTDREEVLKILDDMEKNPGRVLEL